MNASTSQNEPPPAKESQSEQNQSETGEGQKWGYDLYPERRGERYKTSWKRVVIGMEGRENFDRIKCEKNIYQCALSSPIVKLMMGALRSAGCPVDLRRHLSCEVCDTTVSGGYDPQLNQIVVCQNVARSRGVVQGVLAHEMIHMFDYCRNKLDFNSLEHLACTEIRAANLTHCSFMSAWMQGDASPLKIKQAHQDCVKTKAMKSVLAVRKVSANEAIDVVEKVFDKCYNDLEPIGRRIKRNSNDSWKAYEEAPLYGYDVEP